MKYSAAIVLTICTALLCASAFHVLADAGGQINMWVSSACSSNPDSTTTFTNDNCTKVTFGSDWAWFLTECDADFGTYKTTIHNDDQCSNVIQSYSGSNNQCISPATQGAQGLSIVCSNTPPPPPPVSGGEIGVWFSSSLCGVSPDAVIPFRANVCTPFRSGTTQVYLKAACQNSQFTLQVFRDTQCNQYVAEQLGATNTCVSTSWSLPVAGVDVSCGSAVEEKISLQ